jgi:N-hydroxyarylamine O-acetyltransferase
MTQLDSAAVDRYLDRLDLDPAAVRASTPDVETLARLQAAHVRTVPFENLAIVGDPSEAGLGEGVTLDVDHLYEKLVASERGGYCFELNGLFTPLLDALGFEVHRAAAIVLGSDGEASIPANHHTVIVSLDRPYVADVGLGGPQMARPTPLDGEPTAADAAGVRWRIVESGRPAYDHAVQARTAGEDWQTRYVFDRTPRPLSYFEATNDYFASAPESFWTQRLVVRRTTASGWVKLTRGTLTRVEHGERTVRDVSPDELADLLAAEFDIAMPE